MRYILQYLTYVINSAFFCVLISFFAFGGFLQLKNYLQKQSDLTKDTIENSALILKNTSKELSEFIKKNQELPQEVNKIIEKAKQDSNLIISNTKKEMEGFFESKIAEASEKISKSTDLFVTNARKEVVDMALQAFINIADSSAESDGGEGSFEFFPEEVKKKSVN